MATAVKPRPSSKALGFVKAKPKTKKRKNGDEIWDELLAMPESKAFLKTLSEKAHQDYLNGNVELGGFGRD